MSESESEPVKAKVLEERWTSTKIKTAFVFRPPSRRPSSGNISINLPLLNLGWTFILSLTPKVRQSPSRSIQGVERCSWLPASFSFRHNDRVHPSHWQKTSILAELSFEEGVGNDSLGTMNIVLADNPVLQVPLAKSCIIPPEPNKVWLTVTISNCPFPDGLFDARSGPVNEAGVQAQLVRQTSNALSQSLTTGKFINVKFMAPSTRPASGNIRESLSTYASLSVLEERVNATSILGDSWTNALAPLGDTSAQRISEILSPKGHEYDELDSDFEDEDEAPRDCDLAVSEATSPQGQQSDSGTERSSSLSSFSSFDPVEGASDRGSADNQSEEHAKGSNPKESLSDHERTVCIKFAAHRTWHAFLWYCYTGNLNFGKLRSQVEPGGQHTRATPLEGDPPPCSPKSMYRLAELLGNEDLKAKALVAIKGSMTEANVLDEVFSIFTSRYPDVRKVQLDALKRHRGSPEVKKAFLRVMGKYSGMPHAEPALSAFYDDLLA